MNEKEVLLLGCHLFGQYEFLQYELRYRDRNPGIPDPVIPGSRS